jgi:hypothetical protein
VGPFEEEFEPAGLCPLLFVISRFRSSEVMMNRIEKGECGEWTRSFPLFSCWKGLFVGLEKELGVEGEKGLTLQCWFDSMECLRQRHFLHWHLAATAADSR